MDWRPVLVVLLLLHEPVARNLLPRRTFVAAVGEKKRKKMEMNFKTRNVGKKETRIITINMTMFLLLII